MFCVQKIMTETDTWMDANRFDLTHFTQDQYATAITMRLAHAPTYHFWDAKEFKDGEKVVVGAAYSMALGIVQSRHGDSYEVWLPSKGGAWTGTIKEHCLAKLTV